MNRKRLLFILSLMVVLAVVTLIVAHSSRNSLMNVTGRLLGTSKPAEVTKEPGEIVRASIAAYGGEERIRSVAELVLKSRIILYGERKEKAKGRSTEYYRFPDKVRVEFVFDNERLTQLYDGLEAWTTSGGNWSKAPDYLAEGLRRSLKNFPTTILLTALEERTILSAAGPDTANGGKDYVLDLTDGEGDRSRLWFDSRSILMKRLDYVLYSSLGADSMAVSLSDYRDLEGIQTPFQVTIFYNGKKAQETLIDSVFYNPHIPDSLFTRPSNGG